MNAPSHLHSGRSLKGMRISFDIDDTLACQSDHADSEQSLLPAAIHRWLGEPLRFGTRALTRELRRRGCSIWIYTSSGRSPFYIRRWLLLHGIHVDGVVNGERHRNGLATHGFSHSPSKFPPAFGIDLHVDDSDGVRMEGDAHGFRVIVVRPDDPHWARHVLEAVSRAQGLRQHTGKLASLNIVLPKFVDRQQSA